jgi:hypothetical protein
MGEGCSPFETWAAVETGDRLDAVGVGRGVTVEGRDVACTLRYAVDGVEAVGVGLVAPVEGRDVGWVSRYDADGVEPVDVGCVQSSRFCRAAYPVASAEAANLDDCILGAVGD